MFELHPIDEAAFGHLESLQNNLQDSVKKQSGAGSKVALIAAAAAVGGVAYALSPAGRQRIRNTRTAIANWIAPKPEHPIPMWSEGVDPEELEEASLDPGCTKQSKKPSRKMTLQQFRNLSNAGDSDDTESV